MYIYTQYKYEYLRYFDILRHKDAYARRKQQNNICAHTSRIMLNVQLLQIYV